MSKHTDKPTASNPPEAIADTPYRAFYSAPSPSKAVRLAIADARAEGHGTPKFFAHLNRAADILQALEEAK